MSAARLGGVAVFLCLLLSGEALAAVKVYYFHRTVRCSDCLEIERMTAATLMETFPAELAAGRLTWLPMNLDQPENTHFLFDYELNANELVVMRETTLPAVFDKLPEVWKLVQQPEQFRSALIAMVRQHLAQPD